MNHTVTISSGSNEQLMAVPLAPLNARTHARTHARTRLHAHAQTRAHKRAHTHRHTRTHARTHARSPARTYARTHTHERARRGGLQVLIDFTKYLAENGADIRMIQRLSEAFPPAARPAWCLI
jgi:hypothetical protein